LLLLCLIDAILGMAALRRIPLGMEAADVEQHRLAAALADACTRLSRLPGGKRPLGFS
jgi:hypothetical protein